MDGAKNPPEHDGKKHVVGTGGFDFVKRNGATVVKTQKLLGPGGHFWRLKHWLNERLTTKQQIIGGAALVLILGGLVAYGMNNRAAAPTAPPLKAKPVVAQIFSPLTGDPVTAAQAKKPVTAVMIENSDFARPQSGLREAGVVFEAIAEGGITRFMALYQEANPTNIGPIRSSRPYYLEWMLGFDAGYAHVGGSPDALSDIKKWNVRNLDEFYNSGSYHRISTREAPHNVYTSMAALNALEKSKGWTTSKFTGFLRKKAAPAPANKQTAISINFTLSGPDYDVHYAYNAKSNTYLRWEGGAKHVDATTGKQLNPTVVIGMVVPLSQGALDATGAYYSDYQALGSSKVYIFQDGTVTVGTWHKSSRTSQITFVDVAGKPIKLDPGQTWITALASVSDVSYKGNAATTSTTKK